MWIYSFESALVAVVVPNQTVLEEWVKRQELQGDIQSLCNNKIVIDHVLSELIAVGKSKKVSVVANGC